MKTSYLIILLLVIIGIDAILIYEIEPYFDDAPNTFCYLCLGGIGLFTEVGIGLIYYKVRSNGRKLLNP